ncbi:MAG: hypothetical protein QW620_03385 [Thermoplasmata archaeon]
MVKSWEKILVYLLEKNATEEGLLGRYVLTQYGIAEALEMDRAHVSIAIKKLKGLELVGETLEHVKGQKRKVKVYFLTQKGRNEAIKTRERIAKEFGIKTIREILELEKKETQEMFEGVELEEECQSIHRDKDVATKLEGEEPTLKSQAKELSRNQETDKVDPEEIKKLKNRTIAANLGLSSLVATLLYIFEKNVFSFQMGTVCCLLGAEGLAFFVIVVFYLKLFPLAPTAPTLIRICRAQTLINAVLVFGYSFFVEFNEVEIVYYLSPLAIFHFLVYQENKRLLREISILCGVFMIWFPVSAYPFGTAEFLPSLLLPLNGAFFIAFGLVGGLPKLKIVKFTLPTAGICIVLSAVALMWLLPLSFYTVLLGFYFITGLLLIAAFGLHEKTIMEFYIGLRESVVFTLLIFMLACGILELVSGIPYAALLTFIFALVLLPFIPTKLSFPGKTIFITVFSSCLLILTLYCLLFLH